MRKYVNCNHWSPGSSSKTNIKCLNLALFLPCNQGIDIGAGWGILITIYDTVISSEAGDKVFEPGIFLFREVSRFF